MTKNRILVKLVLVSIISVFLLAGCGNQVPLQAQVQPSTPESSPTPVSSPAPEPPPPPPPPPKPASFTTSNLNIKPAEVTSGSKVTIQVTATNNGELSGNYTVVLKINDTVEATRNITLEGGASQNVTFDISKYSAITYAVKIDELSGTFVVKSPPPPMVSTPPSPPPTPPAAPQPELKNPTWVELQTFVQSLELGPALSPLELKSKVTAAGFRSGLASVTLDNGSKTIKGIVNVIETTDYGLVYLDKSSGFVVWNLGVEFVEYRGVPFAQVPPNKLHDTIFWQNIMSGVHFPGYFAKFTVSWK